MASKRESSHAGSWYAESATRLTEYIAAFLGTEVLTHPASRVIISPHAGYTYSGKCAGCAYSHLDLMGVERVFVLGPSHTYFLRGLAGSEFAVYETPLGDLEVDEEVMQQLRQSGFLQGTIPKEQDIAEHSLEMQMPFIAYLAALRAKKWPKIVPILVGSPPDDAEQCHRVLAEYLDQPANAFVISSDFCHWGSRFDYFAYTPTRDLCALTTIPDYQVPANAISIDESIAFLDETTMAAIHSMDPGALTQNLATTGNTVCGRNPITFVLSALRHTRQLANHKFVFRLYYRSNQIATPNESSVGYAAAYLSDVDEDRHQSATHLK